MLTIPRIDLRSLDPDALDAACCDPGFFRLSGHEIAPELCAAVLAAMKDFFALPLEEKQRVSRSAENPWGFYDRELTKNQRDWKEIFDFGPPEGEAQPQWPSRPARFEATLRTFYCECERVARALLAAIERSLGAPEGSLGHGFGSDHTSFLRINYYPRCDVPDANFGIRHHSDAGALTVLLHDTVPGLQVERGGEWHTVTAEPDELIINIGDIVQVWSNDRYRAPLHRVLASTARERFSAPFFFNPSYRTDYAPLSEPPRYRSINWGQFRAGRAAGDYADSGAEIQISDFRI